jgi:adenylate cyclase
MPPSETTTVAPPLTGLYTVSATYRSHGRPIGGGDPVAWVLTEGHGAKSIGELLDKLAWRLVGDGVMLSRATLSVGTLHPQLLGFGLRWWRDRDLVEEIEIAHSVSATADYLDSPMRPAMERGESVRYRLDRDDIAQFPLLLSLREQGATGYLALPLSVFGARHHVVTFATDHAGGFSDRDLDAIDRILPALGVVVEAKALRRLTRNVLDTYLGRTIGKHILGGEIQRRQGETIRAALIATDLRGFTALSDRLPSNELIALLDDYFDAVTSPIAKRGGEVLKFVGDGVLAIFAADTGESEAATAALAASVDALGRLKALNEERLEATQPLIRIGIGLHVGSVSYGNVGAIDRLDFTAIGPAVNLVCRLESLTKRLDRPLLMSSDFAALIKRPLIALGFHPVKGFSEPEEVFGLPAEPV